MGINKFIIKDPIDMLFLKKYNIEKEESTTPKSMVQTFLLRLNPTIA